MEINYSTPSRQNSYFDAKMASIIRAASSIDNGLNHLRKDAQSHSYVQLLLPVKSSMRLERYLFGMLIWLLVLPLFSGPIIAQSSVTFLPFVVGNDELNRSNNNDSTTCLFVDQMDVMSTLFTTDVNQQRAAMGCDPTLTQVAQARAEDMANNNYFDHLNLAGEGPNYLVLDAGYPLAPIYSTALTANQIESIYAGSTNASSVWAAWMGSAPHRDHLLGLSALFAEQNEYGIGYAYNPNSTYMHYWVILTGKRG